MSAAQRNLLIKVIYMQKQLAVVLILLVVVGIVVKYDWVCITESIAKMEFITNCSDN